MGTTPKQSSIQECCCLSDIISRQAHLREEALNTGNHPAASFTFILQISLHPTSNKKKPFDVFDVNHLWNVGPSFIDREG